MARKSQDIIMSISYKTPLKDFLCIGQGPKFRRAPKCSFVGYPLWREKPYPGYSFSISVMIRSLVTFATIEAAAMDAHFESPLTIAFCSILREVFEFPSMRTQSGFFAEPKRLFPSREATPAGYLCGQSPQAQPCRPNTRGLFPGSVRKARCAFSRKASLNP